MHGIIMRAPRLLPVKKYIVMKEIKVTPVSNRVNEFSHVCIFCCWSYDMAPTKNNNHVNSSPIDIKTS